MEDRRCTARTSTVTLPLRRRASAPPLLPANSTARAVVGASAWRFQVRKEKRSGVEQVVNPTFRPVASFLFLRNEEVVLVS
jgi:hypothetical protein